jgi:hypothetical protein
MEGGMGMGMGGIIMERFMAWIHGLGGCQPSSPACGRSQKTHMLTLPTEPDTPRAEICIACLAAFEQCSSGPSSWPPSHTCWPPPCKLYT